MKKYTQKQLKELVNQEIAIDITNYSFMQTNELLNNINIEKIAYSRGINGLNGGLFKDNKTNKLYAITARNSILLQVF